MKIDKSGLDNRVFTAFSETSKNRYIYLCNMQTNVSRWSKSAVEYFGLPGEYMADAGTIWEEYIHPDDRRVYHRDINAVFSGKKKTHELEYRVRNTKGSYVICSCSGRILRGRDGEPDLFAGTIENHGILDTVDATTHLYNLYEFLNYLQRMRRSRKRELVMMIAINQFQAVNDIYGHVFGSRVLENFASLLMEMVRGKGMAYRIDGSKFALCIPDIDEEQAKIFYKQLQRQTRTLIVVDDKHIALNIAGGAIFVGNSDVDEYSIETSVSYALEKSKQECHCELVFFNNEQESGNRRSLEVLETIRQCVLNGCQGFYLCYQPLVNVGEGRIIGMEALLRWSQEPYGNTAPGGFIQWLEQDECFFELGNWILRQALSDAMEIVKEQPDFVVNVNVSYTQLDRSDFRDSLIQILQEIGFPSKNLCLELTERCRTMDIERLRELLEFCTSCGIRIALDDFGTGSASLNLLRQLPINCLKIDRAFISNIRTNKADEIIVELVIECAKKLGMNVCLEGVEDQQLYDYIKKYDVYSHQGYYYSRPVRIDEFKELLSKKRKDLTA